jgi:thiosulfate/3-mercaptopyruvate sulfurtransferase
VSVLVSVEALVTRLQEPAPLVLADVRWNLTGPPGRPQYEAGHLPGAQWVDLETELSGPLHPLRTGGRHPLPDVEVFAAAMRRIGVGSGGEVVAYDGGSSVAAARLWWLLLDAGFSRVRVLDGGFAAWQQAGLPVQTGPGDPVAAGDFRGRPGQLPRLDADAVAALLQAGPGAPRLVDVRAPERYAGTSEPLDPVAGHIPTAANRPSTDNLAPDGRFRPPTEIAERFAGLSDPVLYCGSGITAAHTLLALRTAGLEGRIYPGSWSDWVSDPSRPVATGPE